VVSLVPSATETLRDLGRLPIACTRFCEQPGLPTVGGTKDPDVAAIVTLRPDVVVMNDEENRRADFDDLRGAGLDVVTVSPRTVADVGDAVTRLAALVGVPVPEPFADWSAWLASHRAPPPATARRAVTLVWRRPWMALGPDTYGAAVLAALGVVTPPAADRYPAVVLADVAAAAPDLVLLPSEPYPFAERHVAEVAAGCPEAVVACVDGQDLFWWGTRTPAALTRLASQLA
jgi:ABC-type hemin transport system substrate-binding protein